MKMTTAALHIICNNCTTHSSNTVAWIALIVSGAVLVVNVFLANATSKSATATKESAGATERSAGASAWAAQEAQKEAEATVELVKLGRDQMQTAYLPVVLPRARGGEVRHVQSAGGQAWCRLYVKVSNVGVGPAINVVLDVVYHGSDLPPLAHRLSGTKPALQVGATDEELFLDYENWEPVVDDFSFTISYTDVLRNQYMTSFRLSGTQMLDIVLDRVDEEGNMLERIIGSRR